MIKKYWKKFLKIIISVIAIITICFSINQHKSNADAGYHSSYSGGSSSSSSSYSSRSRYSSRSSNSSMDDSPVSTLFAFIIFIIIVIVVCKSNKNNNTSKTISVKSNENAINTIKQLLPDFDETKFLEDGYKIFLDIEDAWMNFDIEKVRDVITDEMFNMYESQLSSMEIKGEQNIMKDFVKRSACITAANKQNNNIEIKTNYVIEFYDYIIEKETQKVLRGNKLRKIRMNYEFTFIMGANQEKIDKCPNCGAPLDINSSGTCEYCGTKIIGTQTNWVMSKKLCLRQTNL